MNCTVCGKRAYSEFCVAHKPRTAIKTNVMPKRSSIKKVKTRLAMEWDFTRQTWLENNTSPYICHYCGCLLSKRSVTLDHKIPRSRAPHLRNDIANLVACCAPCNIAKGSVDHDHYVHNCPDTGTEVTTTAYERPEDIDRVEKNVTNRTPKQKGN